ncbi:PREDICTED: uncharacterized protein LOC106724125 [Myotis brandtii]|uniref:uncharacterized protein LOC106724125 n=1 Tax=Myotis brandtii TaxID=109478 RepID=UPI0007042B83|nr:PREDICTED: uncharacterized protein LOC106724125 [Myotis brandtii]
METLTSCKTASLSELVPKGYLTQIFQSCPEVEGLAGEVEPEDSEQYDLSSRDESGQNKKKNKVNKIWNFVSRRKGPSCQGKRPQSMILLGDTSKSSELKPKVTLMDRMKSFKRLKTSIGASKNTAPRSSKPQEPQEFSSNYHVRKAEQTPKPFRHSYAGHIEVLEPFLPEAQRLVHTPNRENQKEWTFKDSGIQVEEGPCEKEAPGQPGGRGGKWARSYLKNMFPGDPEALQISARNSRIQELKVIIEGSNLEGNVEEGYEESPGHLRRDKATSFGGVVKFFSNMAEVARKWRAFSREEPQMGCQRRCHPRREAYLVRDTQGFILKGAVSQDYSQVNLPFRPPEVALCGSAIGRHQHCHLNASQASCTFQMSIEGKKMLGQALEDHCSTAALAWMSTSTAFEFQNDPTPQKGYSCHYNAAFTREHCSSEELEEDTETVVNFLKEDDSAGGSPELGTCSRRAVTQAVVEKLEENLSKMEEQEASRGPTGSSQAGQPHKSDLDMDAADTESEASKACTGVSNTQAFLPPAEPSPKTLPLKVLLAKCQSLPISWSDPLELDQMYWRRRRKLCTGNLDHGFKTLESCKNIGGHWKPQGPGNKQVNEVRTLS